MIALVRVDNRLLHGQILETWLPRLSARSVVVADDDAAASPLARAAMTLALPADLPAAVLPMGEVRWADLAASPERVLVLVREVADLERAVAAGLTPGRAPALNVGNVHYATGRRPITASVYLSGEEVEALRRLAARGFEVDARAVPGEPPVGPAEIERRYKAARQG
ncbi:MAG TPA: PTS sugar transporter subunit IIB [Anaeromyxobacteraceae bacterium]|nr:PTS sugar transporter subunit IIB [Anaeromyxobacteraceae bacterium]